MASLREQIINAAVAALNVSRPAGVPPATRLRKSYESAQLPAITVYYTGDTAQKPSGARSPIVKRVMTLVVECRAAADQVETILDPLLVWAVKTLAPSTLGGLVSEIAEKTTIPEVAIKEAMHGKTALSFEVTYQTNTGDMEAKS